MSWCPDFEFWGSIGIPTSYSDDQLATATAAGRFEPEMGSTVLVTWFLVFYRALVVSMMVQLLCRVAADQARVRAAQHTDANHDPHDIGLEKPAETAAKANARPVRKQTTALHPQQCAQLRGGRFTFAGYAGSWEPDCPDAAGGLGAVGRRR